jgi:hypothetical protein
MFSSSVRPPLLKFKDGKVLTLPVMKLLKLGLAQEIYLSNIKCFHGETMVQVKGILHCPRSSQAKFKARSDGFGCAEDSRKRAKALIDESDFEGDPEVIMKKIQKRAADALLHSNASAGESSSSSSAAPPPDLHLISCGMKFTSVNSFNPAIHTSQFANRNCALLLQLAICPSHLKLQKNIQFSSRGSAARCLDFPCTYMSTPGFLQNDLPISTEFFALIKMNTPLHDAVLLCNYHSSLSSPNPRALFDLGKALQKINSNEQEKFEFELPLYVPPKQSGGGGGGDSDDGHGDLMDQLLEHAQSEKDPKALQEEEDIMNQLR